MNGYEIGGEVYGFMTGRLQEAMFELWVWPGRYEQDFGFFLEALGSPPHGTALGSSLVMILKLGRKIISHRFSKKWL